MHINFDIVKEGEIQNQDQSRRPTYIDCASFLRLNWKYKQNKQQLKPVDWYRDTRIISA